MADNQKSLWELESDIFTDYEGTITEATFKFGEFGGQFSITLDEIDGRNGSPTWENYRLPPGWESNDGGETIERVSGDGKGITKGSQYGRFLAAVAGCEGAMDALGLEAPVNASAWIGSRFHFEVTEAGKGKPYDFTNEAGEKVKGVGKDKNYPTVFVGKDSASVQASTSGSENGNGKVDSLSVLFTLNDPVAQEKIKELAKELSHKDWFPAAYKVVTEAGGSPTSHGDLITAMGSRGLYESLGGKG
jgi:hypothetical protein